MTRALLFDIDNTLLWSGGAGTQAMNAAFRDMFDIDNGFARVEFSGRTDRYIFAEALRQQAIQGDFEAYLAEFSRRYYALLPEALRQKQGRLMPGFPQLLEALSGRPNVRLGLATGNFSEGARLKLAYYGLDGFFSGGAFGEESEDRNDVVLLAVQRLADGARPEEILVIGDTPHDVTSALANGVVAVAVATGRHSADELRRCGARIVFEDFSDWQRAAAKLLAAA
ncbi:MAG: haloacid dehalogenase-like hydrolase [Chloroflexi bacterium]|nr:haloacid dehalogenase-like hydrolase [Chloroflexota bacterium]